MTEVCNLPPDIKYLLYRHLVDMRKQFVGMISLRTRSYV